MNKYSKKFLKSCLMNNIRSTSSQLDYSTCYYIYANKYKLDELFRKENQVVFGRRGTGKTTLFKAFTYYVNNIKSTKEKNLGCWYTRLDVAIPSNTEVKVEKIDDVALFCIKIFLKSFVDYLYEEYDRFEKNKKLNKIEKEELSSILLNLSEIIEHGTATTEEVTGSQSISTITTSNVEGNVALNSPNQLKSTLKDLFSLGFKKKKKKQNIIAAKEEKKVVYRIDLNEIKTLINMFLEKAHYRTFYICIDEFALIDRDLPFTIQPTVAQLIKELFFDSSIIVIKIASVWNKSRMQHRQLGGIREGIELGQDIFTNKDLDLDIMFEYDNEQAVKFFKEYLFNTITLNEPVSEKERQNLPDYIIDTLFSQDSFKYLVCGSQGVPRIFCTLLLDCLKSLPKDTNGKITVEVVFNSIKNNYYHEVRQSVPTELKICKEIENYVSNTHSRFFLLSSVDYNNGLHFFDGLVANHALHQCPSEQLPRKIRNDYKLFFVHYGNYLDSFDNGKTILFKETSPHFLHYDQNMSK